MKGKEIWQKALEYQKKVTKYSIEQFNEDEAANVKKVGSTISV